MNKIKIIKIWIIPIILLIIFIYLYSIFSKKIPVSYRDEMMWVGRSYFFDLYIKGDFDNPIWQSRYAYEQPKLAEYVYGAWLYPKYLKEKLQQNDPHFDYIKFLFRNGFYMTHGYYQNNYKIIDFDETFIGFHEDYLRKYGTDSINTVNTVYYARIINFFLLALAAVIFYYVVYLYKNFIVALLMVFFYSFNPLFIDSGLKAHSEALFVLLFNSSLFVLTLYFVKKRSLKYLIIFSILAGLCMSTKLNGIMLIFIYFVINFFSSRNIFHIFLSFLFSILIFIVLNPFTYSNPIIKIPQMFEKRMEAATVQSKQFPSNYLPTPASRLNRIYSNFFSSNYYACEYNNIYFLSFFSKYPPILLILFLCGIFSEIYLAAKSNKKSLILLIIFLCILTTMSFYLKLNWDRYYIQLIFFVVFYQYIGLAFLFDRIKKSLIKILNPNNK